MDTPSAPTDAAPPPSTPAEAPATPDHPLAPGTVYRHTSGAHYVVRGVVRIDVAGTWVDGVLYAPINLAGDEGAQYVRTRDTFLGLHGDGARRFTRVSP